MKRVLVGIIIILTALALGLGTVVVIGWRALTLPIDPTATEPVLLRVEEGMSVAGVASALEANALISSAFWFRNAARVTGATFATGLYHLRPSESPLALLTTLATGNVAEVQVTLPEGWRSEEIADRLVPKDAVLDRASFAQAISTSAAYPELARRFGLTGSEPLEGFLFPDTYRFAIDGAGQDVVATMVANFLARTADLALTYDTVKLASIVEREARHPDDRAPIAGVYVNRLALGMGLEADPTVQYGKANREHADCLIAVAEPKSACGLVDWWPDVVIADYRGVSSPFNTYLHAGLPPTPIANPGLAALEAAANPTDHDYLYFVTDSDGRAHFAKTFAEHQANKATHLR
ncbi:endolytic transglycosylase MltG [Candidatus Berkelbacteria bacterium]|nr:endolytic transglycosylase MltG [Candidatus Berkelbacteria bacterium]